jgi:FKBP-type peptidyl-prolyl cis-trans isomerase
MMRILATTILACCVLTASAQKPATPAKPKTPPKPVAKPATPPLALKTSMDSLSYAIGMLDGNFFKQQGLVQINSAALGRGFSDVLKGPTILTPEQADMVIRGQLQQLSRRKIQPNIEACNGFLAENAKKPGVKTTPSGLQYLVIREGNGPSPADTSTVKVHYVGTLLDGTKFDSSRDRGEPATIPLNGVIRGWTEGVQLMKPGALYRFWIPYSLGYGEQGAGDKIPGGSLLIFEVELLEIVQ